MLGLFSEPSAESEVYRNCRKFAHNNISLPWEPIELNSPISATDPNQTGRQHPPANVYKQSRRFFATKLLRLTVDGTRLLFGRRQLAVK